MKTAFEEKQKFNQWFIWVIILGVGGMAVYRFYQSGFSSEFTISFAVLGLVVALFLVLQLRTKIDNEGIHVQMFPFHLKPVIYKWEDLYSAEAVEYSPLREYGGWGVRISSNGKAFNVKGTKGIKIQTADGRTRMIGTQRFEEAGKAIEQNFTK